MAPLIRCRPGDSAVIIGLVKSVEVAAEGGGGWGRGASAKPKFVVASDGVPDGVPDCPSDDAADHVPDDVADDVSACVRSDSLLPLIPLICLIPLIASGVIPFFPSFPSFPSFASFP